MFDKFQKIALTMKMELEFLITVGASSLLEVRGRIESVHDRSVIVSAGIFDERKKILTRGKVLYYIPKKNRLLKILGKETFPEKLMKYVED